jgi:hypothetical protein
MEEKRVKLYQELKKSKFYTKNYDEFINQFFNNSQNCDKLYNACVSNGTYTKSKKDWYVQFACDLQWAKDGGFCGTQTIDPNSPRQKNINSVFCGLVDNKVTGGRYTGKTWEEYKVAQAVTAAEEDIAKASCSNITPTPSPTPIPSRSTTYVDTTATGQDIINGTLIKKGMKGDIVKKIQEHLNKHGASLKADGKFGPKTKAAVESFQSKKGLTIDGVVGPKTWLELVKDKSSTTTTTTPKPEEDDFKQEDIYGSEEDSFSFPSIIQTIDSTGYGD